MNTPAHSGWLNHGAAIVLAAVLGWGVYAADKAYRAGLEYCAPQLPVDYPVTGYCDNYKDRPFLASLLARMLEDGSAIVLLGSSELTTADHPAKPVNFFNDELQVPLLAIGHAGNQSFSMHAQLIATDVDLVGSRLAILVSPSWFVDKSGRTGTELAAFLEYQPSPSLYRTQQRIEGGDPFAAPVGSFMAEHEHELGSAQPIAQWITRNASASGRYLYAFSQPWNAAIIEATRGRMLAVPACADRPSPSRAAKDTVDWRERMTIAVQDHLARCTRNRFFVNDAYYAEYVQGKTRQLETVPFGENRELRDFIGLLDFLKATHAKPYFIVQPLNPYVYTNLKDVDPTIDRIRQELDARDFSYLDMWVSDTTAFEPGTLTDVMHLGPLGWYRVDSAIAAYFP